MSYGNGRILVILLILVTSESLVFSFPFVQDLYEGSNCPLEDGGIGICKKLPECPSRLQDVRQGRRTSDSNGRCGFEDFIEIVCCPLNITEKIGLRPSESACRQYDNEVDTETSYDVSLHIFGGTEAKQGEFPYMVALGYERDQDDEDDGEPIKYRCGGTLISDRHVLTAAHCVNNINEKVPVVARLGNANLKNNGTSAQHFEISDIKWHPKFKRSTNYNDVAIIKLKKSVRMTESIKPICLQTKSLRNIHPLAKISYVVIGWGSTSYDNEGTHKLMKTPGLSLVDLDTCADAYKNFRKLPRGLDETLMCALDVNSTRRADACHGDSGGPLLMFSQAGHTVIGITAFGQACGSPIPGVYTSVYSYLDWIEEQVWPDDNAENNRISESDQESRRHSFTITIG